MRKALLATSVCLASCIMAATPVLAKTFVYVSAAEDGVIDRYELNTKSGALTPLGKTDAAKLVMPMSLNPGKTLLYAAVRSQPLQVFTYAIDPATGNLTQKATAPLPDSMANISTDRTGHFLFSASYGGDKVAVSKIDPDGVARSPAIQVVPTGKNAHSIQADRTNRFVYASNLGSNQVLQFRFDAKTGQLTPNDPPLIKARPDNGPRHMAFSNDNKYLYVLNELSGNVIQFEIDPKKGTLSEIDYVGTVPADSGLVPGGARAAVSASATSGVNTAAVGDDGKPKIWAADIHITPNGKFMYTTERTKSHVALLSIAPGTGKLTYVTNYPTEEQPRGFQIDAKGQFLVMTGEKSNQISSYRIDAKTGALTLAGRAPVGADANWVEIVTEP